MPSLPSSLAFASLGWCMRDLQPGTPAAAVARKLEALDGATLAGCSRSAVREAGREFLAALASETNTEWLAKVTPALTEFAALPALDALLGGNAEDREALLDTEGSEDRAVVVAARLAIWLRARATGVPGPVDLDRLLAFGWLETGEPPRSVTFYQAYCRALRREILVHAHGLRASLLTLRLEPEDWTRWLAAEAGLPQEEPRGVLEMIRWHPPTMAAAAAAVILLIGLVVWRSGGKPGAATSKADLTQELVKPAATTTPAQGVAVPKPEPTPAPASTPEPEKQAVAANTTPMPVPPAASSPPSIPSPTPPPANPLERASVLMTEAEKAVASQRTEDGDAAARTAQEILEDMMPVHNARVGDELSRVGIYWDSRELWTEAARVHEAAVKCYEKTPAENAAPQLDAVNRWASALRQVGRFTEAERLYRVLLQAYEGTGPGLEVDAATVAHNLANVLVNSGRRKEARGMYERALALMANHWSSDEETSKLAGVMGQNYQRCLVALGFSEDKALSEARRLLKLSPKNAQTKR